MEKLYMQRAIELAKRGLDTTTPNPRVGCVIVKNNEIIGEGYHQRAGQEHAEVNALKNASNQDKKIDNSTAYVTLEPCAHYGNTPPCTDALIEAGVSHVVIGSGDPNPAVAGRGVNKLRQAGIVVTEGMLRRECDELNLGFFKRMRLGLPRVVVKLGMTLDAKIATSTGESQWITGNEARRDVQSLRARSCAVITSSATVVADNPRLDVRLPDVRRQPKRVVIGNRCLSADCLIFKRDNNAFLYTSTPELTDRFSSEEVTTITVPAKDGRVDLYKVLENLAQEQTCNEVLVEAGGRLVGALLQEKLVDELVIYTAPLLLGEGSQAAFNFPFVETLATALCFDMHDARVIGSDLKVTYRTR